MDTTLLIGLAGMAIVLIAFVLNVTHRVTAHDKSYLWLNVVGCAVLIVYAVLLSSIPFMILNAVWGAFAIIGLFRK